MYGPVPEFIGELLVKFPITFSDLQLVVFGEGCAVWPFIALYVIPAATIAITTRIMTTVLRLNSSQILLAEVGIFRGIVTLEEPDSAHLDSC